MSKIVAQVMALTLVACLNIFASGTAHATNASSITNSITTLSFSKILPARTDILLGVFEGGTLGPMGSALDENSGGALSDTIAALDFNGELMSSQLVAVAGSEPARKVLLLGMGDPKATKTPLEWQTLGGMATQTSVAMLKSTPAFVFDVDAQATAQIAFGAKLGSYTFEKYITDTERRTAHSSLMLVTPDADTVSERYASALDPVANAIWLTRDISNEPSNVVHPESFVDRWKAHFRGLDNVKISVLDERQMRKLGMGAIRGVAQGSQRPPRILIVEYNGGDDDAAPVVIVGKGITFDSGGISLKRSNKMWNMKFDMSGAASAMGTLHALAARGAKVNAVGIAALAENLPGGNAQRPGDIVSTMSGKTIEIQNTDAEGRLVLADAMHYADVTYNPVLLVDLATLTGAASRALGKSYAALVTRHPDLVDGFEAAAKASGEGVWRLPLDDDHFEAVQSSIADVVNIASAGPGVSTAAAFVGNFVREETPWVHFDIAGVAYSGEPSPFRASPGSEGFGIRLLNAYITENFEANLSSGQTD